MRKHEMFYAFPMPINDAAWAVEIHTEKQNSVCIP
jgi:hypothetical protein